MRVFIADRDPLVRTIIHMVLQKDENVKSIIEASDGLSVLKKIDLEQPEILLIDLEIPGFSSLKLIRIIRKVNKAMKIIAMLDFYNDVYVKAAFEAGANGYILRNLNFESLIQKIRNLDHIRSEKWQCLNGLSVPTPDNS